MPVLEPSPAIGRDLMSPSTTLLELLGSLDPTKPTIREKRERVALSPAQFLHVRLVPLP